MTGRRPLRLDPALLALQIGLAVEEAAELPEAVGHVIVVMDTRNPAGYQILRGITVDASALAHLVVPSPSVDHEVLERALRGSQETFIQLPPGMIAPPPPAPHTKRKAASKKIIPTKKPPSKATRRKPPTRRKRKP